MKKAISTVSVFLLLSTGACRSGNDDVNLSEISREEHSLPVLQRDSVTQANGGKDEEPPRKDLQQWKQLP